MEIFVTLMTTHKSDSGYIKSFPGATVSLKSCVSCCQVMKDLIICKLILIKMVVAVTNLTLAILVVDPKRLRNLNTTLSHPFSNSRQITFFIPSFSQTSTKLLSSTHSYCLRFIFWLGVLDQPMTGRIWLILLISSDLSHIPAALDQPRHRNITYGLEKEITKYGVSFLMWLQSWEWVWNAGMFPFLYALFHQPRYNSWFSQLVSRSSNT